MDLTYTEAEQAFRRDARAWLEANVPSPALPSGDTAEGFALHREWERRLFTAGWAVVSWPKAYGGREASPMEWLIFEEEYWRAGGPQRVAQNGIFLLAPTLFEFGTPEQRDRLLPRMAAGVDVWAQGWSEPNAGSDLASITSRAVRDEARGGWRLTGQKTWCTRGVFCDWMFGLFRSDPTAERHRGLTYFLVPLRAEGVTVRPVRRLDGDVGFAEVFLEDAFVPDRDVLGGVNLGWDVAMATTSSERGLTLRSPGRFLATAARLVDLYRRRCDSVPLGERFAPTSEHRAENPSGTTVTLGAPPSALPPTPPALVPRNWGQDFRQPALVDATLRDRVVRAWMDAEAYQLYTLQTVTRVMKGEAIGAESSINKVFWSEMDVRIHETALDLLGPLAELAPEALQAVDGGVWMKGFQFALAGPIYAGTNEIQRNVIAERVLGLPRK